MPAGRPTKYKPEMCGRLIALMGEGMSKEAACHELGIVKDTLYRWAKEKEEFSDALKRAELACAHWWEEKGKEAAQGKIEGFNATAFVWMTKNVLKWSDRQSMEVTGKDGGPVETNTKVLTVAGVGSDKDT